MSEFEPFPKIARLRRGCVITEKIDGTNAQIAIDEDGNVRAGSRKRWITPEDDNFGFGRWVADHVDELRDLGPGRHFGEWWGLGIQRTYDLDSKQFSLFNTSRWAEKQEPPACCGTVPVLYAGEFDSASIEGVLDELRSKGSVAAPGFMRPEGIVIYHPASRQLFKVTLEDDEQPKSVAA